MRAYDAATIAYLGRAADEGVIARYLFWIEARDRDTGAPHTLGLWTGQGAREFTVEGQARIYLGDRGVLDVPEFRYVTGLRVPQMTINLTPLLPELQQAIRLYTVRRAPVQIHRVLFDPDTRVQVGAPHRMFQGRVVGLDWPTEPPGSNVALPITLAPSTDDLTRALSGRKSDAAQQRRSGDRFRRYAGVGAVPVYWGENAPKSGGAINTITKGLEDGFPTPFA